MNSQVQSETMLLQLYGLNFSEYFKIMIEFSINYYVLIILE